MSQKISGKFFTSLTELSEECKHGQQYKSLTVTCLFQNKQFGELMAYLPPAGLASYVICQLLSESDHVYFERIDQVSILLQFNKRETHLLRLGPFPLSDCDCDREIFL